MKFLLGALICAAFFAGGFWFGKRSTQPQATSLSQTLPSSKTSDLAGRMGPSGVGSLTVAIPPNASPELKEFLQNKATLMQKMMEARRQNASGTPGSSMEQFRQENAALIQRQTELAEKMGQQQGNRPLPEMLPRMIPANVPPAVAAYIQAQDQLRRDQMEVINQNRTADPQTRQAAMQLWRQQNAARFQQLQQMAQSLSKPSST